MGDGTIRNPHEPGDESRGRICMWCQIVSLLPQEALPQLVKAERERADKAEAEVLRLQIRGRELEAALNRQQDRIRVLDADALKRNRTIAKLNGELAAQRHGRAG